MPNFQAGVNQTIRTAVGVKTAATQKKEKAARASAQAEMTTQLQSLSQRIAEMEKAKQTKSTARKWLDNILGGGEIG